MSYSDPHLIVGFWIIVGGTILIFYVPYTIPLFILLIGSFGKYNQKKLSFLYSIPVIFGVIFGINNYLEEREARIAGEKRLKELELKHTKHEEIIYKNYIKYYDEEKKIICNETSRKDLFNLMLQMKPRSAGSISYDKGSFSYAKNIAEIATVSSGGNEFLKKYPEFSNLNFNRHQDIQTGKANNYKFDLTDSYNTWMDMHLTWKDISPSDLKTLLQNICKSTTDEYIQYVKNPNNFKQRKLYL
jgi:hypothetical protein